MFDLNEKTPQIVSVIFAAWQDFRRHWSSLVLFEAGFKLLEAWLLVPAVGVALGVVMARAGHVAVSDWDILDFLLTPFGLIYAGTFGVCTASLWLLQQAGVMVLVENTAVHEPLQTKLRLPVVLSQMKRVIQLGTVKLVLLVFTFVPFLLLLGLTYFLLLSHHDINYYLAEKPSAYWIAVGIGSLILLGAVVIGTVVFVRWSFAIPILLFEHVSAGNALRDSNSRITGAFWQVSLVLLGWQGGILMLGAVLNEGFRLFVAALPASAGVSPAVLVLLLIVRGVLLAVVSAVGTLGQALLVRRLYLSRCEQTELTRTDVREPAAKVPECVQPGARWRARIALAVLIFVPVGVWAGLSRYLTTPHTVQVTAHRGHARAAPENTRSAIEAAIRSGADFAEVDVQLTTDGQVVLVHDRDLKRVTGDPRRLEELTFVELEQLDAGSWFNSSFTGERIPTLADVMDLSRGRIKLNIELKYYGSDPRLAREVGQLIRDRDFEKDCIVTSFNYDALLEMRKFNTKLRTGVIIATAVGDVTKREGEVLSIRADGLSDSVLRQARRRGLEVHVWTVNDERQMVRLMMRGVDNILTSDPDLLIQVRSRWKDLSSTEELVLASRFLLGLD